MVVRNVVRIGGSYYVALPKGWAEEWGVASTRQVRVEVRDDGVLEVIPVGAEVGGSRVKRVRAGPALSRLLMCAYLSGYEVVEVDLAGCRAEDVISTVERLQRFLIGLEVVEEGRDKVVIQCFTRANYDVKSLLYRMDTLSRSMYVDAVKAFEEGDAELARSVVSRDDRLDRIYLLTVRTLRTRLLSPLTNYRERLRLVDYRLLARDLEELGDIGESIACSAREGRVGRVLTPIAASAAEMQEEIVRGVLEDSTSCIVDALPRVCELHEELRRAQKKLSGEHAGVAVKVEEIIKRIKDIADLQAL